MCYAIPGRVVRLEKDLAVVEYFGEERKVLRDFSDVKVGDYVYAQGGVLINVIPGREALEILEAWKERFFELKEVDRKLSKSPEGSSMSGNMLAVLQKANLGKELSRDDIRQLLEASGDEEVSLLAETANNVRQRVHDNACCVHGILEFSNYCTQDCLYCGIRREAAVERYRMTEEEIIAAARHAVDELGFKALVLQSGEDAWYDEEMLVRIVREIRKLNILIFISIGMRPKETYRKLYEAGARACLLRFETANPELFRKMRPGTSLEERLGLIRYAKELGYVIATGFISGLPGETVDDTVENIMLSRSLAPHMYSFGPLVPTSGTPLGDAKRPTTKEMLKQIAATRLLDRDANILVTTALETIDPDAKKLGLLSGGNSLMINATPEKYKHLYRIYDNKAGNRNSVEENINETIELLYALGRAPTDLGI